MLTIAQFGDRTGISPSALRFYERKGLLAPAKRLANGYRVYASTQMEEAQLINSLREAGVSVAAIREFLELDAAGRQKMLVQWRQEVAARLLSIQMADQYLRGLRPDRPQIHLHRWEEPSVLLWFPATAPLEPLPFAPALAEHGKKLQRVGVTVLSGGYVRTLDIVDSRLVGEVGFRVKPGRGRFPAGVRVQETPPTLFATLVCTTDDEKAAHRIFQFLYEFGFVTAGLHLERYLPGVSDRYQLMVAVTQS
ncbi:MAG: MerR family transcriptional regulator [Bacillota bacterium]